MIKTILLLSLFFVLGIPCFSLPLSTNGRWIVDAKTGQRVKLTCANWPSHVESMLAEGLDKKPLDYIIHQLSRNHFNCVRFTYATHMYTRYANRTVSETFDSLNLTDAKAGIAKYNPSFLSMTHVQAFDAVVDQFGAQGVLVVLDNQVSRPTWCCGYDDGNGFFGDKDFDAEEWLQALATVADRFKGKSQVIGISTRNELRGPSSNEDDWYKYMHEGGSTIHRANPDVLIFVSGIGYASDLTYLQNKSLDTNFDNKLVYEAHWYPFSWGVGKTWDLEDVNGACYDNTQYFVNHTGFVINGEKPFPMFLGEFGIDQRGLSRGDEHFMACFMAYAADTDVDWGFWAWQGSYYYRENQTGTEETFGVMNFNWNRVRNPEFQNRMQLITKKLQDPSSNSSTSYIMFHALSGSCIHTDGNKEIYATSCKAPRRWSDPAGDVIPMKWLHDGDGAPIRLKGTKLCLKALGEGLAPILSEDCSSPQSSWKFLSKTKLHLAATDENGEYLCLQKESPYTSKILTNACIFMNEEPECGKDPQKDPVTQWFKLVKTNLL
ncbi:hydrolase, hydrolyzing O-glycosyl compounds, putative [Ricinus communis]|uniref:Hydrolase, hydrolyzing O-glycosyl compounds, putative n=2 Tax=Ricinus communis TaxID=3988 RepID=B9RCJ3_RICCO|nr:hydrolase, hydrolyzing O-glycosyl compounds, putative [Ricinus communis]